MRTVILAPTKRSYEAFIQEQISLGKGDIVKDFFYAQNIPSIMGTRDLKLHLLDEWYRNDQYNHDFMRELRRRITKESLDKLNS